MPVNRIDLKRYPWKDLVLGIVIIDFSREAALRFCVDFSNFERQWIKKQLPDSSLFYDEYRRVVLYSIGDLPFVKENRLSKYRQNSSLLDNKILVGFSDGIEISDIVDRIGTLIFKTVRNFIERNIHKVLIMNPCNTLSPVSWILEKTFTSPDSIKRMLRKTGEKLDNNDSCIVQLIIDKMEFLFPTVPEAVIRRVEKQSKKVLLPLGTNKIVDIYRQAITKLRSPIKLISPDEELTNIANRTINLSIDGDPDELKKAVLKLKKMTAEVCMDDVAIISACTDFNYEVGLNSNTIYAKTIADLVYNSAV